MALLTLHNHGFTGGEAHTAGVRGDRRELILIEIGEDRIQLQQGKSSGQIDTGGIVAPDRQAPGLQFPDGIRQSFADPLLRIPELG